METIKAIIADDEEHLRIYLKKKLQEIWPELDICGEAGNGNEALELIETQKPDIAFLDIKMPGMSGMDVAAKVSSRCRIVFITAYEQFAVDAFDNQAIDYLLKPVSSERLLKTVERLKAQHQMIPDLSDDMTKSLQNALYLLNKKKTKEYLRWIKAQHRDNIRLIPVDDVFYFKSSSKYTTVITREGESLIKKPIKELAVELDPEYFWRIHRGTIVNARCIDKVNHSFTGRLAVKLKSVPEILTVSRTYSHIFRQM